MILETTTKLLDYEGEQLADLTVGTVLSTVLASTKSDNPALSWQLGKKIATEEKVDLKAEDIVFIKKQISQNEGYTPIVTGQVMELLDK